MDSSDKKASGCAGAEAQPVIPQTPYIRDGKIYLEGKLRGHVTSITHTDDRIVIEGRTIKSDT